MKGRRKMNIRTNKGGFTLLEIIIVIIIVGVLVSLALPRFFSTVEFSKSAEALSTMGVIRSAMERCYLANGGTYSGCNTGTLDIEDQTLNPNSLFSYTVSNQTAAGFTLLAGRKTNFGGDQITIIQNTTSVTRTGSGKYVGIK